jgi:uncharacterized membrane protein YagU involved in acid resistance
VRRLKQTIIRQVLIGALAGLGATIPMTVGMEAMFRFLPKRERYPLPPRQIAMALAEEVGVKEQLTEPARTTVTLAAHFGYGAATGAIYAPMAIENRWPPLVGGIGFGLAVWAASYLGLLPAVRLLSPATEHPLRRNALMITGHIVWGVTLGLLVDALNGQRHNGQHQASDDTRAYD